LLKLTPFKASVIHVKARLRSVLSENRYKINPILRLY